MASALRLTGAFRAAAPLRVTAFNGLRCYSTGKTTVSFINLHISAFPLTAPIVVAEGDFCQQASRRNREDQEASQVRVCVYAATPQHVLILNCREHGHKVVGEVTLDQVYGGARGIKSLVWEVCDTCTLSFLEQQAHNS
jgi:citrate synthase